MEDIVEEEKEGRGGERLEIEEVEGDGRGKWRGERSWTGGKKRKKSIYPLNISLNKQFHYCLLFKAFFSLRELLNRMNIRV